MRALKFGLLTIAVAGFFGSVFKAEIALAESGNFTTDDAYAQMGGMPFQMAILPLASTKKS